MSPPAHATCVAWKGRGLLIEGPSGSGKSALALALMAMGCDLVADDRVLLSRRDGGLWAAAPASIAGLIEIRGTGIARVRNAGPVRVVLVTDLSLESAGRCPAPRQRHINDVCLPLIGGRNRPSLHHELMVLLRHGRQPVLLDPEDPTDADRD